MSRRRSGDKVDGWVILDKPVGLGSTPAVSRVRRLFGAQKAGHGGTLDPLASGVLPIALGIRLDQLRLARGCNRHRDLHLLKG